MSRYLVSAQAIDRPGVVAVVSGAIAGKQWSVEDATMSLLAGRFAMLLIVSTGDATLDEVRDALGKSFEPAGVLFTVEPVDAVTPSAIHGDPWVITVYGSDRPGIVATVAHTLANEGINIDDLSTRVSETQSGTVYTMLIDATVPRSVDGESLISQLVSVGEALGVTCHAAPVDADIL